MGGRHGLQAARGVGASRFSRRRGNGWGERLLALALCFLHRVDVTVAREGLALEQTAMRPRAAASSSTAAVAQLVSATRCVFTQKVSGKKHACFQQGAARPVLATENQAGVYSATSALLTPTHVFFSLHHALLIIEMARRNARPPHKPRRPLPWPFRAAAGPSTQRLHGWMRIVAAAWADQHHAQLRPRASSLRAQQQRPAIQQSSVDCAITRITP